ncbi:hypothetical protein ES703_30530 [subsurface metagenome]
MDKGFYEYELINNLEGQIDLYEGDRDTYWGNQSETGTIDFTIEFDRAERFAKAVLTNAKQLIPVQEIDGDLSNLQYEISKPTDINKKLNDILNSDLLWDKKRNLMVELFKDFPIPQCEDSPLRLVWERFIIDMSWEAIQKIEGGASRIFQLYNLVLCSAPSKSTQTFLSRLSRCFVWGFDPECIILCRAVIDTGFRDFVHYEICEKHGQYHTNSKGEHYYNLANRIIAAFREGIIDAWIKQKAFIIKERGDKAVHDQPGIMKNVWGTICDTIAVLERITEKRD